MIVAELHSKIMNYLSLLHAGIFFDFDSVLYLFLTLSEHGTVVLG
jgi:hypothetical protein